MIVLHECNALHSFPTFAKFILASAIMNIEWKVLLYG
jgi:hypothetical protein